MKSLFYILLFMFYCDGQKILSSNFSLVNLTGFPANFIFSSATASYQIEGAWNTSGKGENIWDRIVHSRPNWVANSDNGDIACDSYHKYKDDVKNLKYIGFHMYRLSLSWSRLFPTGFTTNINADGVHYYSVLLDELLSNGIEPMVTLYHWDLPQPLEDLGGWLNPDIAEIFGDYARSVFKLFGDKVKWWVTINEPQSITAGYGGDEFAPALKMHGIGEYESAHNILRAHGKAYRIYEREFKQRQKGKVSLVINGDFYFPKNASDPSHIEAVERGNQFMFGWFAHPIYSEEGDYPPVMREYVDRNSKAEGRNKSRLPHFTQEEIQEIKGSFDYMGLNHYTSKIVEPGLVGENPSIYRDQEIKVSPVPGALRSACDWLQGVSGLMLQANISGTAKDKSMGLSSLVMVVPEGLRALLNWMKKTYNNPEIFITENGYCDSGDINDQERIHYHQGYLKNLMAAIKEDNCRILGYTVWSIMDNFEWKDGFTKKFGLIKVDFKSSERSRTMKLSAKFFRELIHKNFKQNEINVLILHD